MTVEERHFWMVFGGASVVLAIVTVLDVAPNLSWFLLLLSSVILTKFLVELKHGRFSVDLLMGIAGLATWFLGAYFEGFLIFSLYSLAEILEDSVVSYAEKELRGMKTFLPPYAVVFKGENYLQIPLSQVMRGDIILVRKGEVCPVDGFLLSDEGLFNTSYLTGESLPRRISKGSRVLGGYINVGNAVKVSASTDVDSSSISLLIRNAEEAVKRKSWIQRVLDRVVPPYTAAILLLYLGTSLLIGPYLSLSILLAGCPSALIITSAASTSLTIGILAREGVVVKGGDVLDRVGYVKAVILDKTGTLTTGKYRVTDIYYAKGRTSEEVLRIAASVAKGSIHPVSESLAKYGGKAPERVEEFPGSGVKAWIGGSVYSIGSRDFILNNISGKEGLIGKEGCNEGGLSVYIAENDQLAGIICMSEEVSDDVSKAMEEVKNLEVEVFLTSGDTQEKVEMLGEQLGIENVYGDLSPNDKSALLRRIKGKGVKVAMVGDGINDLEALAEADVGIAVGSLSIVGNVADAVLTRGVRELPKFLKYGRSYRNSVMLGFASAIMIKVSVIILGITGVLPLWAVVGLGDDGSTVIASMIAFFVLLKK